MKEYSAQDLNKLLSRYFAEVRVEGLFGVEALNEIERKRVKQKPGNVYLRTPFKKYVIRPIISWVPNSVKTAVKGALPRRAKKELANSRLQDSDATVTEPVEYPFATSDLELRDNSLGKALDLRAIVLRVE